MYESEAKKKWQKENTVFIGVKLQKSTDADIIEFLRNGVNKEENIGYQTIIKAALREYMEKHHE